MLDSMLLIFFLSVRYGHTLLLYLYADTTAPIVFLCLDVSFKGGGRGYK